MSSVSIQTQDIDAIAFVSESAGLLFGDIVVSNLGNATLTLVDTTLVVGNIGTSGEDGVQIDLGEAQRYDAVWEDIDPEGTIDDGAYATITKYGGGTGFSDQIASTFQTIKSAGEWGLSADFSEVGAAALSLVAVLEDSIIVFDTGYVAPIIWWPNPPDDDHWPSPWPLPDPWPFPDYKDGSKSGTASNGCWPTEDDGPFPFSFPASPSKGTTDIVIADCIGFVPEDDTLDFDNLSKVEFRLSGIPEIVFTSLSTQLPICCIGIRGNIDSDPEETIDISDLVYLVDFMFTGGPAPACHEEADVNGDGGETIDIGDLVYLVAYMFTQGPEPPACGSSPAGRMAARAADEIGVSLEYVDGFSTVSLNSPIDLRGIQLELKGRGQGAPENLLGDRFDLVHGRDGWTVKMGILDLDGGEIIEKGNRAIVRLDGEYTLKSAQVADPAANSITPVLGSVVTNDNLPSEYGLCQNFPNPFNPRTSISFALPKATQTRLEIFNLLGQRVVTLIDTRLEAGRHAVDWEGCDGSGTSVASGVYFYRLETPQFTASKKMLLLK